MLVLIVLAILGHGYAWVGGVNRLHAWPGPRKWVDWATLVCFVIFLILPVLVVLDPPDFSGEKFAFAKLSWPAIYFYLCVISGAGNLLLRALHWYRTDNRATLRDWQQQPVPMDADASAIFHGDFANRMARVPVNEALHLKIDRKRLAIPRLSAEHEGLTIAHISDLHMTGRLDRRWYETITAEVSRLGADMIVVTGDIVEKEACWPWLADTLGTLRAENGVYFILGNHDFYIDADNTRQLLENEGLVCLSNRWVEIPYGGGSVAIAGNERPWNPHATDVSTAPAKSDAQLRIALLHTPDQIGWARENDADLALAGHTHGGQIRFPLLGPIVCPSRYGTRYACGVFRQGNTVMHVSRGLAGKTPLRWRCPPEIALLELVRQ